LPAIKIAHLHTPAAATEYGTKGMGEGGAVAPPAAIANAVCDALLNYSVILQCCLAEAFDAGEDVVSGFGPSERLGRLVVGRNKAIDRLLEFVDRSVDTATNLLLGQQAEEALDLVDPISRGRREVQMIARPPGEPVVNQLGFMAGGIVEDKMDIQLRRDIGVDFVEEAAKLDRAMTL
jgi:hypothetical protein